MKGTGSWRMLMGAAMAAAGLVAEIGIARADCGFDQAWEIGRTEAFRTIDKTSYGVFAQPIERIIQNPEEWRAAMDGIDLVVGPAPEPPAGVDWQRDAVVLISLGEFSSAPAGVEIREVRRLGHRLLVDIDARMPGSIQTFCAPVHMIAVPRAGLATLETRYTFTWPEMGGGIGLSWGSDGQTGAPAIQPLSWGSLKTKFQ
jgi:hypothetical protein